MHSKNYEHEGLKCFAQLQKTGVNMLIFEILKIQAAILETDFQTVRCFSEKASYQEREMEMLVRYNYCGLCKLGK